MFCNTVWVFFLSPQDLLYFLFCGFIGVTFCTASCILHLICSLLPWIIEYIVLSHHAELLSPVASFHFCLWGCFIPNGTRVSALMTERLPSSFLTPEPKIPSQTQHLILLLTVVCFLPSHHPIILLSLPRPCLSGGSERGAKPEWRGNGGRGKKRQWNCWQMLSF